MGVTLILTHFFKNFSFLKIVLHLGEERIFNMSSYSITLANNGSDVWTPSARRAGTASSGGTSLTLPWVENTNAGTNTTSKTFNASHEAAFRAVLSNFAAGNPGVPFHIEIVDNGSGVFTPSARYNGTAASGGTALTMPWIENTNAGTNTTTKDLKTAFRAAQSRILADRAAGN